MAAALEGASYPAKQQRSRGGLPAYVPDEILIAIIDHPGLHDEFFSHKHADISDDLPREMQSCASALKSSGSTF